MCIIAAIPGTKGITLLKNRDRNYSVKLNLCRVEIKGMECVVLADALTEWIEGMNEEGISIVNSALMVGRDESEKKKSKKGRKSKDGARILRALKFKEVDDVLDSIVSYRGGIKGHTFVHSPEGLYAVEMTSKHTPVVKKLDPEKLHVRTNHGIFHADAGYTEGDDRVSSKIREKLALKYFQENQTPEDLVKIINTPHLGKDNPYNMVRDTEKMRTSSQLIMCPEEKTLYVHLLKKHIEGFTELDLRRDTGKPTRITTKMI